VIDPAVETGWTTNLEKGGLVSKCAEGQGNNKDEEKSEGTAAVKEVDPGGRCTENPFPRERLTGCGAGRREKKHVGHTLDGSAQTGRGVERNR